MVQLMTRVLLGTSAGRRLLAATAESLALACRSPQRTMGLMAAILPSRPGRAFLRHYLKGEGRPLVVDTGCALREDRGLAGWIAQCIRAARSGNARHGQISVPQWRLSTLRWRLALGSCEVQWRSAGDVVLLFVQGRYDWHPAEDRLTRSLHRAAESLKPSGASPFTFHGPEHRANHEVLRSWWLKALPPCDRIHM